MTQSLSSAVHEGEVLPPAPKGELTLATGEAALRAQAYMQESRRLWSESLDTLAFNPFAEERALLMVVLDPWASTSRIPKCYRPTEEPGRVPDKSIRKAYQA